MAGWLTELLRRGADSPGVSPAARSARRVPPATVDRSESFTNTALDILRDENGRPVLDPITGRPMLDSDGPQPTSPEFTEENFDLDSTGTPVPMEKPDPRLAVLEAIGLALRGMDTGAPGPVVRNNALADLIAERQALRNQEIASLGPHKNEVPADNLGRQPSSDLARPARPTQRPGDPAPAPDLPSNTLSEEPFEQLIPVAVDGPLMREYVPALDEFGNVKADDSGNPIPSVTVDRWDPAVGAYVTTAPGPPKPVSEAPVFEQTLTGETHQRTDPTTGLGATTPVYENLPGQIVRRGPQSYYAGRMVKQPDGSTRIEVDQSKPVTVLERSRNGSDGNRSAESRVFLTPRNDGTYQVLTMADDGTPTYLRATDFDVQRLLAQGFEPVHGSLSVARPTLPESPEALARAIVETRAGTVSDGQTYRVGVDSPEAKADIIAQVEQLRRFGSVDDLRRFFEELGSARVQLDDVGAGADNAVARGQMAYKAFVDSGIQQPPAPRSRPQMNPNAVREDRIRRLTAGAEQVVGGPASATDIPVGNPSDPGFQISTQPPRPDFTVSPDGTVSPFTSVPNEFDIPQARATTSFDVLSGLNRFDPAMIDAGFSPTTAGAGMMDFTITPEGQATLNASALDDLLGRLSTASTRSADVGAGALPSAETFYPRLPDTFLNQFATASGDVSGSPMPTAARERPLWTRSRGILPQPLAERVRAARARRETGLSMPTPSAFDEMLRGLQPDLSAAPAEENVRQAVEQILRGNANRRVSEQGRVVESADPTVLGPEPAVRSSTEDRFSTMVDADAAADTEKVLRGADSTLPHESGLTRDDLREMAIEGLGQGSRAPLAFKTVEMRSPDARPGKASFDKMADRSAAIEALRESLATDYPDPSAVRARLAEISDAVKSGRVSSDDRAALRAERATLKEKLADSESPEYMQARESALTEIDRLERAASEADEKFGLSTSGSVADAQQTILDKLLLDSPSFREEEFLKAAEDLFGVTSRSGVVDSGSVFDAIRTSARNRGMPEPTDSDIIYAALDGIQHPTRHAMGPRGLRSVSDYIAQGLSARRSNPQYGPDAPVLSAGPHDRPKSVWEAINDQFSRVAGPMLDQPAPPPQLPAVYDQFIPPFLRLPATLDDMDLAFRGMTVEETQRALEQLNAAESASKSVPLPPTQDPARLAEIIAAAREAGRRRLGNVPAATRRPMTLTDAETSGLDLPALERDVDEWRRSIAQLEADAETYPPKLDSKGRPIADHPEVAAAKQELKDAEQRLDAARQQASASAQGMEPPTPSLGSPEYRSRLFTLAAKRASLQRTQIAAESSADAATAARVREELAAVDSEIDALSSGASASALVTPRKASADATPARLSPDLYTKPAPVQLRSSEDLRNAVTFDSDNIGYAFVVPKETAAAMRARTNQNVKLQITGEPGPEEAALSGLIPDADGNRGIAGGIRFMNPSDLRRLPTDGSVEVIHLDKDGRPTFYDPSGMDLRSPTARELEEAAAADSRQARGMQRAAEDEAIAIAASESPVARSFEDASQKRTEGVRASRLARQAQKARARQERADLNSQFERNLENSASEQELSDIAARGRRSSGLDDDPPAARDPSRRPKFDESEVGDSGYEGDEFVPEADPTGRPKRPGSGGSGAGIAGRALGMGGVGLLGFAAGRAGLDMAGSEAQASPIMASTLVEEPVQEDTNSSAENVLDRVRRARQYNSYLVSGHMMPR